MTWQLKANATECILTERDPNRCWGKLLEIITRAADKHCPLVKLNITYRTAEYVTSDIIELQPDRDYFKNKSELTNDPGNCFIVECLTKKARLEVRKAKSKYCLDQIIKHKQDHKRFYR